MSGRRCMLMNAEEEEEEAEEEEKKSCSNENKKEKITWENYVKWTSVLQIVERSLSSSQRAVTCRVGEAAEGTALHQTESSCALASIRDIRGDVLSVRTAQRNNFLLTLPLFHIRRVILKIFLRYNFFHTAAQSFSLSFFFRRHRFRASPAGLTYFKIFIPFAHLLHP